MADATFYEGDRQPDMEATLLRGGAPIDLTNATGVTFKFWRKGRENLTPLIDAAGTIEEASDGEVKYAWAALDLDLYGRFSGIFVIDWTGKDEGVPDTGYIDIQVFASGS